MCPFKWLCLEVKTMLLVIVSGLVSKQENLSQAGES